MAEMDGVFMESAGHLAAFLSAFKQVGEEAKAMSKYLEECEPEERRQFHDMLSDGVAGLLREDDTASLGQAPLKGELAKYQEDAADDITEMLRMIELLDCFSVYIEEQDYFEVLYSHKLKSLICIIVDEQDRDGGPYEIMGSADEMYDYLLNAVCNEVMEFKLAGEHAAHVTVYPAEIEEIRRRITAYISAIHDAGQRETYARRLEEYLARELEADAESE